MTRTYNVIDADGHWVELFPVFFDFIAEVGSPADVDKFRTRYGHRFHGWYALTVVVIAPSTAVPHASPSPCR